MNDSQDTNQNKRVQLSSYIFTYPWLKRDRTSDNQEALQLPIEIESHVNGEAHCDNYKGHTEQIPDAFQGTSDQPIVIEESTNLDGYLEKFNELSSQIVAIKFPSKVALNISNKPSNIIQNSD
mgnify:FL=1